MSVTCCISPTRFPGWTISLEPRFPKQTEKPSQLSACQKAEFPAKYGSDLGSAPVWWIYSAYHQSTWLCLFEGTKQFVWVVTTQWGTSISLNANHFPEAGNAGCPYITGLAPPVSAAWQLPAVGVWAYVWSVKLLYPMWSKLRLYFQFNLSRAASWTVVLGLYP